MSDPLSVFLVLLIVVPLVSAAVVAALGPHRGDAVRWVSLASTVLSLVLSIVVAWDFTARRLAEPEPTTLKKFEPAMQTQVDLLPVAAPSNDPKTRVSPIQFYIGLDGLSVWLVVLTTVLMVCAVAGSWTAVHDRVNEYYAWLLALQMAMVGVFLALDIVLFYVFFELTLVPLFFLIGIWGGPQRQYAARKFFIFTLAGSLITLLGVLGVILVHYNIGYTPEGAERPVKELTFSIPRLAELTQLTMATKDEGQLAFWLNVQKWVFLALMVGFAIKVPLVPVHTWLPLAHVEAPTAGSVLLAGVLLKVGTYGFLRLCLPLAPDASVSFGAPFIGTLAVIGIIYGAFCALQQDDMKKMVAYSSVSHLGFCMLGMFALNEIGLTGSLLQMINHGLSTGALFLLVGMLYERYHTRKIDDYGGMGARLKLLAVFFVFITMSSIGLPGLNGFIGEVMVMMGAYGSTVPTINGIFLGSLAAVGVVLGAWYMLTLVRGIFFGEVKEPHHEGHAIHDLDGREVGMLTVIALLCLLIGLYPQPLIKTAAPELRYVTSLAEQAQNRRQDEGRGARGEGRGKTDERATLPRTRRLAEGHKLGEALLPTDEGIPEGRVVRDDLPDSPGRRIDSREYRGGKQPGAHEGVFEPPQHRQGIARGTRNTPDSVQGSRTVERAGSSAMSVSGRRNQSNVGGAAQVPGVPSVTSSFFSRPSPLAPRPSLAATRLGDRQP
jgi:NADH-quinone oxidoreductase subunit M